jgi:hypothetical protein
MKIRILTGGFSVCRFAAGEKIPNDIFKEPGFASVTRTEDEISIVRETSLAPASPREESGWRMLMVEGPLDFGMVGVLSSISAPLARAGVSIFALSTFDTDYIMVKETALDAACAALSGSGFALEREPEEKSEK